MKISLFCLKLRLERTSTDAWHAHRQLSLIGCICADDWKEILAKCPLLALDALKLCRTWAQFSTRMMRSASCTCCIDPLLASTTHSSLPMSLPLRQPAATLRLMASLYCADGSERCHAVHSEQHTMATQGEEDKGTRRDAVGGSGGMMYIARGTQHVIALACPRAETSLSTCITSRYHYR